MIVSVDFFIFMGEQFMWLEENSIFVDIRITLIRKFVPVLLNTFQSWLTTDNEIHQNWHPTIIIMNPQ